MLLKVKIPKYFFGLDVQEVSISERKKSQRHVQVASE